MFTGLIQHIGAVASVTPTEFGSRLAVDVPGMPADLAHGESIAINGCCLTLVSAEATSNNQQRLHFDVIHQTLRMTTLGSFTSGTQVNVERSATPSTLLGGHIVQGHVDGVGEVVDVNTQAGEYRVRLAPPTELMRYIIDKGSITIDGVSLTIASVNDSSFEVALIPTTLELTTLSKLARGSKVNLEADALAKMVEKLLAKRGS